MGTTLEKDVEALNEDIERLRSHLGDVESKGEGLSQGKIADTKERLRAAFQDFQERVRQQIQQANEAIRDESERAIQASRDRLARKPITVVGVSFAVGLATALLVERRRH